MIQKSTNCWQEVVSTLIRHFTPIRKRSSSLRLWVGRYVKCDKRSQFVSRTARASVVWMNEALYVFPGQRGRPSVLFQSRGGLVPCRSREPGLQLTVKSISGCKCNAISSKNGTLMWEPDAFPFVKAKTWWSFFFSSGRGSVCGRSAHWIPPPNHLFINKPFCLSAARICRG